MRCIKTPSSHKHTGSGKLWYSLECKEFPILTIVWEFKVFQVFTVFVVFCHFCALLSLFLFSFSICLRLSLCRDFFCYVCSSCYGGLLQLFSICDIIFHPLYLTRSLVFYIGVVHSIRRRCPLRGVTMPFFFRVWYRIPTWTVCPFILFNLTYSPFRSFHTQWDSFRCSLFLSLSLSLQFIRSFGVLKPNCASEYSISRAHTMYTILSFSMGVCGIAPARSLLFSFSTWRLAMRCDSLSLSPIFLSLCFCVAWNGWYDCKCNE